jgi:hypothetical protein
MGDRRGKPRFEVVGELWGTLDTVVMLPLRNVGRGGALLESPIRLPLESTHRVTLRFEDMETDTRIRIRHLRQVPTARREERYLIGVEFLGLPAHMEEQISRWSADGDDAGYLEEGP